MIVFFVISSFFTLFLGSFIRLGWDFSRPEVWMLYGIVGAIFPFFAGAEVGRRVRGWVRPYTFGSILLGSGSIAFGMAFCGYLGIFMGFPVLITVRGCMTLAGLLIILSLWVHWRGPRVVHLDLSKNVAFSKLSKRYTVVQLSDIHLSHHTRLSWVQNVVKMTQDLNPDFILFTGDFIDVDPSLIPDHIQTLSTLTARYGKFAVSGNHDFMTGISKFNALCEHLGFTVLDNASAQLEGITFVGVPDEMAKRSGVPGPNFDLLKKHAGDSPVIFLKHRPTRFKEAVLCGANLQLSGHSHRGQLPPWGILVRLRYQKYAYGLHAYKTGHIYTSCGTGVWGPPMRLFGRAEIVKIVI